MYIVVEHIVTGGHVRDSRDNVHKFETEKSLMNWLRSQALSKLNSLTIYEATEKKIQLTLEEASRNLKAETQPHNPREPNISYSHR